LGHVEGTNVTIEYHSADGRFERLPALAADFVRRRVAVIIAPDGGGAASAAKAATDLIPILFIGGDPVSVGLVASLARPGGNVTGHAVLAGGLMAKRLELLHQVVLAANSIALLVNPANAVARRQGAEAQMSAR
jgi:putative tryptophan/tyrosine transport system substrate-binding protein